MKDCYISNGYRKGQTATCRKKYRKQLAEYMVYHVSRTRQDRLETIQDWIRYTDPDVSARFLVPMHPINADEANVASNSDDNASTGTTDDIKQDAIQANPKFY